MIYAETNVKILTIYRHSLIWKPSLSAIYQSCRYYYYSRGIDPIIMQLRRFKNMSELSFEQMLEKNHLKPSETEKWLKVQSSTLSRMKLS